ncbi:hypothetical protein BHM03_00033472 [Ensete ventricosum]|uniref:beta-ketoacyl-[acyl-carrier-protein] synthase I n=1 Tax=Ensete ventricosum TaxID=4639 RepID=A0A426X4B6_ENSVE|nr:hypothetical protein B296_00053446 [Ensete ventricosum]RZS03303.1 hypothetical protein BHM03_00033472 [Ensete ventricosum]
MFCIQVNYINAHATSTVVGDLAEINAAKQVFKNPSEIKMNATKSMIGHCLGAAGGLEAIATLKAITTGWLHPSINQFVSIKLALGEEPKRDVTLIKLFKVTLHIMSGFRKGS